jgi:hypothetical protein
VPGHWKFLPFSFKASNTRADYIPIINLECLREYFS